MIGAANDNVSTLALYSKLPLVVHQSFSRSSQVVLILILVPLLVSLATPFALIAETLIYDPEARMVLAGRPGAAAALLTAIFMLAVLFGWPLYRLLVLASEERSVRIEGRMVEVRSKSLFGSRHWTQAVPTYLGVAKGVRSTLSGVTHELLLVHADHRRTVVLATARHPLHEEAQALARLLGVAEISTRTATSLPLPKALTGLFAAEAEPSVVRI